MMQTALHGSTRTAEDLGDRVLVEVVVVAEDDDASLRLGERGEQPAGVERGVVACGSVARGVLDAGGAPGLPAPPGHASPARRDGGLGGAPPKTPAGNRTPPT